MSTAVETITVDALSLRISRSKDSATVAWTGVGDSRSPGVTLVPAMERVCGTLKGCSVVVDFAGLEFVNSATISPMIQFVRNLSANGCPVLVVFDADADWQRTHMLCMKTIARTLTGVRVESQKRGGA